jgi:hypothetical protein
MQEMASTQSKISKMLGNLNVANDLFSGCTSTTAPEIALTGQEPMAIGLLLSALDGPGCRMRLPRATGRRSG